MSKRGMLYRPHCTEDQHEEVESRPRILSIETSVLLQRPQDPLSHVISYGEGNCSYISEARTE